MTDSSWDLATLIVAARAGGSALEAVEGVVTSDDGGGTVTVNIGGTIIPGCKRLTSYTSPATNDAVLVLLVGNRPWVLGASAAP